MPNMCTRESLIFHPLTPDDRKRVQAVTLGSGRRNCNFNFANLIGWQFWFNTEVCICHEVVVFRFNLEGRRAYMLCSASAPSAGLLELLCHDAATAGAPLLILNMEDEPAAAVKALMPERVTVEPRRNQYDYIYRREDLAKLKGGSLKAKRNHVNKFLSIYPDFEYRPLEPSLFDECRRLARTWRTEVEESQQTVDQPL